MYILGELIKDVMCSKSSCDVSGKIKELLSAELDIPVSKMELHGWPHKNDALIQDTVSVYVICILSIFVIVDGMIVLIELQIHVRITNCYLVYLNLFCLF